MIRVFITTEKEILNIDNDQDAINFSLDPLAERELPPDEITEIFGGLEQYAGPENTTVAEDGTVYFDRDKALSDQAADDKQIRKHEASNTINEALGAGVEYHGVVYQCGKNDVDNLTRALTDLNLSGAETIEVRALDNEWYELTAVQFKELCALASSAYQKAWRESYNVIDG